ncbi:hypothetical protein [Hydrogenophaga sp.]|uniref:hypothetical protein n=1 Tax=Hydrogenophaga sp. TaxID=1904254 RepID=UPI00271D928C|nr:hypothetical protein [Hydrogenophaga sp.]MDO9436982.1 hypothetical protein [Hydrogenophaga sp.]
MDGASPGGRMPVGGGVKRVRDDNGDVEASAKKPTQQRPPHVLLDRWMAALNKAGCNPDAELRNMLEGLTREVPRSHPDVRMVYGWLLSAGEHDVFLEIFKASTKAEAIEWEHAHRFEAEPPPFKSKFLLHVGGTGQHPDFDSMVDVLSCIGAQEVRVWHEVPRDPLAATVCAAMPVGVSRCIAALLKGGATALHIRGALLEPSIVASAFAGSLLETVKFEQIDQEPRLLSPVDIQSYTALADGLASCARLKHVEIGNGQLLALDWPRVFRDCLWVGWAALESVRVTAMSALGEAFHGHNVQREREEYTAKLVEIVKVISQFRTLSVFETDAHIGTTTQLREGFLGPLEKHPSLTRLSICSAGRFGVSADNMTLFFSLMSFAAGCKKLTDLIIDFNVYVDFQLAAHLASLLAFQAEGGDVDQSANVEALVNILLAKDFPLKRLRVTGACLPAALTRSFFGKNSSLLSVDLAVCVIDFESLFCLMASLKGGRVDGVLHAPNLMLQYIGLPRTFDAFYWKSSDGRIVPIVVDQKDGKSELRLQFEGPMIDPSARRRATESLEPYKAKADVFDLLDGQLITNRRAAQVLTATSEMQTNLEHFMLSAWEANMGVKTGHTASSFSSAAEIIANHLNDVRELTVVARLRQVQKIPDARKRLAGFAPFPDKPTQAFRELARVDGYTTRARLEAIRVAERDAAIDALPVNATEANGDHRLLMDDVRYREQDDPAYWG